MMTGYSVSGKKSAVHPHQRNMVLRVILLGVGLSGILFGQPLHEQHRLTVVVDGAKFPDRIPDDLAYRHFILSIAERRDSGLLEIKGRETRLKAAGLSDNDKNVVLVAVDGLREELNAIEAARRAALASSSVSRDRELASLKAREERAFAAVIMRLGLLSPEGKVRLEQHVRTHVKKRIVIVGDAEGNAAACCPAAASNAERPQAR